jgi:hypothetical protein
MARLRLVRFLAFLILPACLILSSAQAAEAAGTVDLVDGVPGLGIVKERFMIAVPITNEGTTTATNVQVTSVTLGAAARLSPTIFPVALGAMPAGFRIIFQCDFDATGLVSGTSYSLIITGTYQLGTATSNFTLTRSVKLLPESPGQGVINQITAAPNKSAGPYPPQAPRFGPGDNEPRPPVPIAPVVAGPTTPTSTSVQSVPNQSLLAASDSVTFNGNYPVTSIPQNLQFGIAEPSGSSGGGMIFVSFNFGVAFSTDGGSHFTVLDPTTMFNDSIKFCCDQVVQYVAKINRYVWLMQGASVENGGVGGYRLATASPAAIASNPYTAWTYWELTPTLFGQPPYTDFDFPSMSVGTGYIHINWDIGFPACGGGKKNNTCNSGREVISIPLSQIQAGGTIQIQYTDPSDSSMAWADHLTQDTGNEIFWVGHNGTSLLRVFSWPEGSSSYSWTDVPIFTYNPNYDGCTNKAGAIITCPKKDGKHIPSTAPTPVVDPPTPVTRDWLFRAADDAITGATRSGNQLWFAWNAAPGRGLPQPYIEMVEINASTFTRTNQVQIWNPSFAFALPSLSTNECNGEIGLSLAHGGGGTEYPNHSVGFWGDFLVYDSTASDVTTGDFGDYVTIRQNHTPANHGAFFDAFGYGLTKLSTAGTGSPLPSNEVNVGVQYVIFGRGGACATGARSTVDF